MGGFGLDGVYGRVPCPYCGSTDCMGLKEDQLYCCETKKIVSEMSLRRSAKKHKMTTYKSHNFLDWELHEITYVGDDFREHFKIGDVELYNNKHGVRGLCPNLKTAREFVRANRNDFRAYFRNSTEADE